MSFWSKLFGGGGSGSGGSNSEGSAAGPGEDYKGYTITPVSMSAGAEWQLAGRIEKDVNGERKRHDFVRADRFGSNDEAASMALAKGRQIVDEQGDRMFPQAPKPN